MQQKTDENLWLTAADCADSIGLTVRALRLYETLGLITPRRTEKNWRLYGAEDIARLNEITALKRFGLSLARITELLAGQATDLDGTLAMQQSTLLTLRDRVDNSLSLIAASRTKIAAGENVSITELIKLMKETKMTDLSPDTVAWRRYEQARPRTQINIDAATYVDLEGHFQFDSGLAMAVISHNGKLATQTSGQSPVEIYPESELAFFYKLGPAQITFIRDAKGIVDSLVLHNDGHDEVAKRIDAIAATALADALRQRIRDKTPIPNGEALLRTTIADCRRGQPDYGSMSPPLEMLVRQQAVLIEADLTRIGALKTITFKGVSPDGWDIYDVTFANGVMEWGLSLGLDGKFAGLYFRPMP